MVNNLLSAAGKYLTKNQEGFPLAAAGVEGITPRLGQESNQILLPLLLHTQIQMII